jgi:hypothetical protein
MSGDHNIIKVAITHEVYLATTGEFHTNDNALGRSYLATSYCEEDMCTTHAPGPQGGPGDMWGRSGAPPHAPRRSRGICVPHKPQGPGALGI